ncbi:MAG: hypothetical protein KDJ25_12365 [Rhodoblastus sp.]|nr:hypothetical protein [Rhodoblastus sp.]
MRNRPNALLCIAAAAALGASCAPALAQKGGSVFDKPISTKTIQGKQDGQSVVCTVYPDVTVRESLDGPTSDNAKLLRGADAPCGAKPPTSGMTLATDGLSLEGRKGDFLVFSEMDPQGVTNFSVIDARSGKVVLKDATYGSPAFKSANSAGGATTLAYARGIGAKCSLLNSGMRCWSSIVMDGMVPEPLAHNAPDPMICAGAYKKAKSPKDDPSIISFDVETKIDAVGKVKTIPLGKPFCDAMP